MTARSEDVEKRLRAYQVFSKPTIKAVAKTADWQNRQKFAKLWKTYGVGDLPSLVKSQNVAMSFEYALLGNIGVVSDRMDVLYAPFACPVDKNMVMRAMRLHGALRAAGSERPMLVVGNPGALGRGRGAVSISGARKVARGNFGPSVYAVSMFLQERGVKTVRNFGGSLGALQAVTAPRFDAARGYETEAVVGALPVGVDPVGVGRMALRFARSGSKLDRYVKDADSPPLNEARQASQGNILPYLLGLLRATNIATVRGMSRSVRSEDGGNISPFEKSVRQVPSHTQVFMWRGERDELTPPHVAAAAMDRLTIKGAEAPGLYHAGLDDIDVHAACMLEGLHVLECL